MPALVKEFVLTHIVKNISSLKEKEDHYSEIEEHFGVPWRMRVFRKDGHLEFYLYCEYSKEDGNWSIETERDMKIKSVTGKCKVMSIKRLFEYKDGSDQTYWGWDKFIKWEEMEKDYMIDGDLMIETRVKILKMTGIEKKKLRNFDESMKEFSDIVLIVDDEKFYVSKLTLATQSTYFEALFLRKFQESEKSEITLKDVDSKDFQNFLELLYGESPINDETVEGIVKLADMYDAKLAIRKCEEYLINESEKTLKEKLQMAKQYDLEQLKNKCVSQINTATEIRSVLSCDLNDMDRSVVNALFQKSLALIP